MDKKSFFENLIGKRFWYLSGDTVRLVVEEYSAIRKIRLKKT